MPFEPPLHHILIIHLTICTKNVLSTNDFFPINLLTRSNQIPLNVMSRYVHHACMHRYPASLKK